MRFIAVAQDSSVTLQLLRMANDVVRRWAVELRGFSIAH